MNDDELFDDDLFEDEDDSPDVDSTKPSGVSQIAGKYGLGGFASMSEKDVEDFKQSDDYKNYSAEIDNDNIKADMHGKTVQEILGLTNLKESVKFAV